MSYSLSQQILRSEDAVGNPLTALVKRGVTVTDNGWTEVDASVTLTEHPDSFRLDFSRYSSDREELVHEIAQDMDTIADLMVILMETHEFLRKTLKKIEKGKI